MGAASYLAALTLFPIGLPSPSFLWGSSAHPALRLVPTGLCGSTIPGALMA